MAAQRAAEILAAGTGSTQPEILAELRAPRPDLAAATQHLQALSRAGRAPAFTPEPGRSDRLLRGILAQPRYDAVRAGPSLSDRLRDGALRFLLWALGRLGGAPGAAYWGIVAAAALGLTGAALILLRAAGGGFRSESREAAAAAAALAPDRFAEADRRARAGDLTGAIRALAGGVAAALGDDRAWEISPLTVRELFSGAPHPDRLQPLLAAFEAAVYGGLEVDRERYAAALAAAAPYRSAPAEVAA